MGNLHSLKRCNTYFENLIIYRLFIKIGNFDNYSVSFLYACILIYLKCLNEIWNRFEFDLNFLQTRYGILRLSKSLQK